MCIGFLKLIGVILGCLRGLGELLGASWGDLGASWGALRADLEAAGRGSMFGERAGNLQPTRLGGGDPPPKLLAKAKSDTIMSL